MRLRALPALAGLAWLAACRPAGPPTTAPAAALPATEPTVRVGIAVNTPEVAVGADSPYEISIIGDGEVRAGAGERWVFTADAERRLVGRGPDGRRIGPVAGVVRVRALDRDRPILIGDQPYRGGALLRAAGPGRVTAINILDLESYLLGVVPMEIGVRPAGEIEAVKAQAVAARTYAVGHLGSRETLGFDFYATVADQVYGGVSREDPVTSRAVWETRGEIVAYEGLPIMAYYHSTCGGRTAAIDEVWPRPPSPYLKSVSDAVEGEKDRYYCEISNRFRWTVSWTGSELRETLSRTLARRLGGAATPIRRVEEIETVGRTPSGRVATLRVVADGRTHEVRGDSIRRVLEPQPGTMLNSTLFVLDKVREGGEIRSLQARGGGWGHGIGMCQMGAIGRARDGQSYRRILTTYYRDTEILRLY